MRNRRRPYKGFDDDDPDSIGETLADVNDRLDDLARQIARIARRAQADDRVPTTLEDALAHFDRRLDEIVDSERAARGGQGHARDERPRRAAEWLPEYQQPQPEKPAPAAETSARISAPVATPAEPTVDLSGLEKQLRQITEQITGLQQPCHIDDAVGALRNDLAQIGRAFNDAMPRSEIGALEREVRALAERVDHSRDNSANVTKLAQLEKGLTEIRDALRNAKPVDNLAEVNAAVKDLSRRVEQLGVSNQNPAAMQKLEQAVTGLRVIVSHVASNDSVGKLAEEVRGLSARVDKTIAASQTGVNNNGSPAALQNLAQAVSGMRTVVSQVASNDMVGKLTEEVRGLSARIEQSVAENTSKAFSGIDQQIKSMIEGSNPAPAELKALFGSLGEQINHAQKSHAQLSQGDKLALGSIEERIVKLSGKLDASDAWMSRLDAIERGMADVLVYLEQQRSADAQGRGTMQHERQQARHEPHAESRLAPQQEPHIVVQLDAHEAAHEEPQQDQHYEVHHDLRAEPAARSAEPVRADSETDTPIAPVSEPQFMAPEHAIHTETTTTAAPASGTSTAPIFTTPSATTFTLTESKPQKQPDPLDALIVAASEAKSEQAHPPVRRPINPDLPPDTPIEPNPEPTSLRTSAAERIADSEAALGGARPPVREVANQFETLIAARRAAFAASSAAEPEAEPFKPAFTRPEAERGRGFGRYLRWLLFAACLVIIVLVARMALDMWEVAEPSGPQPTNSAAPSNLPAPSPNSPSNSLNGAPDAPRQNPVMPMPGPETAPGNTQGVPNNLPVTPPDAPNNEGIEGSSKPDPLGDAGGANGRSMPEVTGALTRPDQDANRNLALPTTIGGPVLRAAATDGNPAAEYEVAVRFSEGRGVTASIEESARWLERAAKSGFAPAQFRLGGLYDKGGALKRDRAVARSLYAAAAEKGHAKAMHNLAVLYAEGIDGRPNYRLAAHWFRKASEYGVADSQYNLAILCIRGIGVEQNLVDAYKWFALAANQGDQEAGRKRDEVAERLDPPLLNAAQIAVQTFYPAQQPEQAVSLRVPPGGWDRSNTTAQPTRPRARPADPPVPNSLLSPAPL